MRFLTFCKFLAFFETSDMICSWTRMSSDSISSSSECVFHFRVFLPKGNKILQVRVSRWILFLWILFHEPQIQEWAHEPWSIYLVRLPICSSSLYQLLQEYHSSWLDTTSSSPVGILIRQLRQKSLSSGISLPCLLHFSPMVLWISSSISSILSNPMKLLRHSAIILFFTLTGISNWFCEYTLISPLEDRPGILPSWTLGINILTNVIAYAIGIASILWVIGVTWWGIQMVLSTGDDEKLKKGRYILIYSLIGVLLAGLAYSLVNTIMNFRI